MTILSSERLNASCVAIGNHAVLIEGLSGAGKSDLSLRLIDSGAKLVSDDYTIVSRTKDKKLTASPPLTIAGKIEVRGIGIITMDFVEDVPVALLISAKQKTERMPISDEIRTIVGVKIPVFNFDALDASAPAKARIALGVVTGEYIRST